MNSIKFIIIIILSIHQIGFGQWETKSVPTTISLSGIDFLDDDNGFVLGKDKIFKTTDGGDSWETSYDGNSAVWLIDIFIIDANKIIAVGKDENTNQSAIVKTEDNGDTWELITLSYASFLNSVVFVSSNVGFSSGSNGTILKTVDSGDTWQELNSEAGIFLQSIYFIDNMTGIAAGGNTSSAVILKTSDGGDSWTSISTPTNNYLQSTYFIDEQTGYAVGWLGEIIKTEDCGSTWTSQSSVSMDGNFEILFTDINTGYIVGGTTSDGLIQKTVDGGATWQDITPSSAQGLRSVSFPSSNVGYAIGTNGSVLKTESGGVITSTSNLPFEDDIIVFPNPSSNSVSIETSKKDQISLIKIYDNNASLIQVINEKSTNVEIDLSKLQSGFYYLEVNTESKQSVTKLIKQ